MTDKPQNDGNQAHNAAILLKVAQTMAKLGVAAFPRNYELFYEALSGSHPQLTRDVAALGAHPAQNQIEQVGIKYHLSGFAAIEADTIRADTARSISSASHALKDSIAKKEVFAAMLRSFITRLETDPVAGMSDFAEDAARLRDAVAVFEREEKAFAAAMNETVTQLGGIDSDIETMRKASTRDPVTGLPNRIAFSAKLTALFDDGTAVGPAALALVTVEGLRDMGERHGATTVEKALKEAEKDFGAPATITGFVRFALGEGVERETSDFAAEVAAYAGKK